MNSNVVFRTGIRPITFKEGHFSDFVAKEGDRLTNHVYDLVEVNSKLAAQVSSAYSTNKTYNLTFNVSFLCPWCILFGVINKTF